MQDRPPPKRKLRKDWNIKKPISRPWREKVGETKPPKWGGAAFTMQKSQVPSQLKPGPRQPIGPSHFMTENQSKRNTLQEYISYENTVFSDVLDHTLKENDKPTKSEFSKQPSLSGFVEIGGEKSPKRREGRPEHNSYDLDDIPLRIGFDNSVSKLTVATPDSNNSEYRSLKASNIKPLTAPHLNRYNERNIKVSGQSRHSSQSSRSTLNHSSSTTRSQRGGKSSYTVNYFGVHNGQIGILAHKKAIPTITHKDLIKQKKEGKKGAFLPPSYRLDPNMLPQLQAQAQLRADPLIHQNQEKQTKATTSDEEATSQEMEAEESCDITTQENAIAPTKSMATISSIDSVSNVSQQTPLPDMYNYWIGHNQLAGRCLSRNEDGNFVLTIKAGKELTETTRPKSTGSIYTTSKGYIPFSNFTRKISSNGNIEDGDSITTNSGEIDKNAKTNGVPYVINNAILGWKLTTPAQKHRVENIWDDLGMNVNEHKPLPIMPVAKTDKQITEEEKNKSKKLDKKIEIRQEMAQKKSIQNTFSKPMTDISYKGMDAHDLEMKRAKLLLGQKISPEFRPQIQSYPPCGRKLSKNSFCKNKLTLEFDTGNTEINYMWNNPKTPPANKVRISSAPCTSTQPLDFDSLTQNEPYLKHILERQT